MSQHCFFVTGTDTDAGKTYVSALLLQGYAALGITALGAKPLAAGAEQTADGSLQNSDALLLKQHSGIALPYAQHNPVCLAEPAAPHLVAAAAGVRLDEPQLTAHLQQLQQTQAQRILIEGAGGWLLPLSEKRYLADWVLEQQLPVVLVVGIKLGCLNHAMLTVRELERSGAKILGWVANIISPEMLYLAQNIADLTQRIHAPLLATVPYAAVAKPAVALQLATALEQQLA
ncbi:MAG: dethiobiotin synthase [Alishewanella aestuarii]